MKKYTKPVLDIIELDVSDIIQTSGETPPTPPQGGGLVDGGEGDFTGGGGEFNWN